MIIALMIALASMAPDSEEPGASRIRAPSLEELPEEDAAEGEVTETDTDAEPNAITPERVDELEARIETLEAQLEQARTATRTVEPSVRFSGYVDFGFFVPVGNGEGVIRDVGGQNSHLGGYEWVFLGDLLSTAVNSRGEAASLGELPGADRFDSVNSEGAAGFLLNEVNLTAHASMGRKLFFEGGVLFVPRSGREFSIGDFIEVDLAQLEWVATDDGKISIYAGKIAPVLGLEYRRRRADDRFGITPSLVARYTSGSQLGVKARTRLFDGLVFLTAAATNGSSVVEQFHFSREVDANDGKTLSGRAALRMPLARWLAAELGTIEVGVSGQWGPQDMARDNDGALWLAGADLQYFASSLEVRAEFLMGRSPGRATDGAYALELNGTGSLEVDWMAWPVLGFLARAEFRDALVHLGSERAYLTKGWRITGGVRVVPVVSLAIKAEYLRNLEYGEVPSFDNDIFTTSLVWKF